MRRVAPFDARDHYYYYNAETRKCRSPAAIGGAAFDPVALLLPLDPHSLFIHYGQYLFEEEDGTGEVVADEAVGYDANHGSDTNPAIQATANNRPLYKEAGGFSWIEGDGSNDALAATYSANLTQPWVRVSALRILTAANAHLIGGGGDNIGVLYMGNAASELRIFSGTELTGLAVPAEDADFVATERHHGNSSRLAINNGAYNEGAAGATAATGMTLCAGVGGASDFSNCRVYGSVVLARDASDADIALCRTVMARLYGGTL